MSFRMFKSEDCVFKLMNDKNRKHFWAGFGIATGFALTFTGHFLLGFTVAVLFSLLIRNE